MFYSPLRYPGGKNKLSKFIAQVLIDNKINGTYIEPYSGGAAVALSLLIEKKVKNIIINDKDRSIYAFWYCVLAKTEELCNLIQKTEINIENWHIQKQIQKQKQDIDIVSLGFSTFFLNRTNRSGIIGGGVIGGLKQQGNYKIDCRFNKKKLIEKIQLIAKHKNNISVYNNDATDFCKTITDNFDNKNTLIYFDPPYYKQGASLYASYYKKHEHKELSDILKKLKALHWLMSYDNCQEIRELYKWANKKEYSLNYCANVVKQEKEVLFFSKNIFIKPIDL